MLGFGGARCGRRRVFQSIETLRFWNRRRCECLTTIKYVGNLRGFGLSDCDFASSRRRDVCRCPDCARGWRRHRDIRSVDDGEHAPNRDLRVMSRRSEST